MLQKILNSLKVKKNHGDSVKNTSASLGMEKKFFLENISPWLMKIPVVPLAAVNQNAKPSAPIRPLPVTLQILVKR